MSFISFLSLLEDENGFLSFGLMNHKIWERYLLKMYM